MFAVGHRLRRAVQRRAAKWISQRRFQISGDRPIISFTFDDFPLNAFTEGGAILESVGAVGTYYLCCGLFGQTIETGRIVDAAAIPALLEKGHELGCHTFHHHPAWETSPATYEASVERNSAALSALVPDTKFPTHSYPISYPRPATKRRLARRFRACRSGGQIFNHHEVDLNYLNSYFIEQSGENMSAVEHLISENARVGGWLIFSTHDVSTAPTRYGCRSSFFEKIVRCAADSGAKIMTMSRALDELGVPRSR